MSGIPAQPLPYEAILDIGKTQFNRWVSSDEDFFLYLEASMRGGRIVQVLNQDGQIMGQRIETQATYDREGNLIYPKAVPKLNEEGIRAILHFAQTHLNKNVRMSNVTTEEVYHHAREVARDFNDIVAQNDEQWEIDPNFHDELMDTIIEAIWFSYNRPKGEGERIWFSKVYTENLNKQVNEDKTQGGGFRLPFPDLSGNKR